MLDGVTSEFICENINTWMPHYVDLTAPEIVKMIPTVIVDGEKCPQVAEHLNTIVT